MMEDWKSGMMEDWKSGMMEDWKNENLQLTIAN
jgi:hypothetical protein